MRELNGFDAFLLTQFIERAVNNGLSFDLALKIAYVTRIDFTLVNFYKAFHNTIQVIPKIDE
jgi:hypothetical protein